MTARDKLTEYAASWIADCGESYDDADVQAARLVQEFRAEVAEEFAARLEAFDRAEAAALVRRMAAPTTTQET